MVYSTPVVSGETVRVSSERRDRYCSGQGWHLGRPLGPLRLSHPRRALGGLLSTCISRACHLARTLAPLPSIAHTRNTNRIHAACPSFV